MKARWLILLISLVSITGCNINKINEDSLDKIIDDILSNKNEITNINARGYQYYLPININKKESLENNQILYSKDVIYYLYVDIFSYFNKIDFTYEEYDEAYYSQSINDNGYLEINKLNSEYLIEMMYNYSKIEVCVSKEKIEEAVTNSIYILSSIKYNDTIIDTLIGEKATELKKENLDILKPKREEGNFLQYIEKYDKYEDSEEEYDDDEIQINEEEL